MLAMLSYASVTHCATLRNELETHVSLVQPAMADESVVTGGWVGVTSGVVDGSVKL